MSVIVAPLKDEDAAAARALVIDGLTERWGEFDPALNPDLKNFPAFYKGALVLAAKQGSTLIGTGVLRHTQQVSAEIVRMSVAKGFRRRGIGSLILIALLRATREQGFKRIALETTATWESAVKFYVRHGFVPTETRNGDQYFLLVPSEN
jgi:GNAT superfamily N-acetyltransferase